MSTKIIAAGIEQTATEIDRQADIAARVGRYAAAEALHNAAGQLRCFADAVALLDMNPPPCDAPESTNDELFNRDPYDRLTDQERYSDAQQPERRYGQP